MYALYLRFVEQVKQEEIKKYNERHLDYLIRAGKMQPQPLPKQPRQPTVKPRKERQTENARETVRVVKPQTPITPVNDERPLKGSDNYNIPQEQPAFEAKPIKNTKNPQRIIQQAQPPITKNEVKPQLLIEQPIQSFSKPKNEAIIPKLAKEMSELPPQFEEVVLVECPEGCGKKFNEKALEKHVRLCSKGEVKRKVFNVKVVDDEAMQLKKEEKAEKKESNGIPKWKKESNRFRNAINAMNAGNQQKNGESKAPPAPLPDEDDRVECPGCGRKFNPEPAAKHIPNCVRRNANKK